MKLEKDVVWAVIDPEKEFPIAFGHSEHGAWVNFFKLYAHHVPLCVAKRAYGAIGFRCNKYRMVPE